MHPQPPRVSETFRSHCSNTRWICSHRTRSADIGFSGGGGSASSGEQCCRSGRRRPASAKVDSSRHGGDGSCDIAVSGKHDDPESDAGRAGQRQHQAVPIAEAKIENSVGGFNLVDGLKAFLDRFHSGDGKAALLHCAGQTVAQEPSSTINNDDSAPGCTRGPMSSTTASATIITSTVLPMPGLANPFGQSIQTRAPPSDRLEKLRRAPVRSEGSWR